MKSLCIVYAKKFSLDKQDEFNEKFTKKSIKFSNMPSGDLQALKALPDVKEVSLADLTRQEVETHVALSLSVDDLDAALSQVLEAVNRFTLLVVVAPQNIYFYGYGINSKIDGYGESYSVNQMITTICNITDVLLPENPTGEVLYAILKDPNSKTKDLIKAQRTIDSLEEAISRNSRMPWDKHDCA